MSDQGQSVWPDGARAAVKSANEHRRLEHFMTGGYDRWADGILTALEPFVQQRIEKATRALDDDCRGLRDLQSWVAEAVGLAPYMGCYVEEDVLPAVRRVVIERDSLRAEVARLRQERDHANALAEAHRLAVEGARETLNEERVERSQAEQILADVDADRHRLSREVARLREDGERLDWLERAVPNGDFRRLVDSGKVPAVWPSTVRGFIDAARSAPGGEG